MKEKTYIWFNPETDEIFECKKSQAFVFAKDTLPFIMLYYNKNHRYKLERYYLVGEV